MNFACALKLCLLPRSKSSLCRRLEAGIECIDEPGRETCLCDGNLCNLSLPALRETQPQLEFWHVLILLVPVLLVLLALGATAFWAIRRRRRGNYNPLPPACFLVMPGDEQDEGVPILELGLRLPEGRQEEVAEVAVTEARLPSSWCCWR